MSCEAELCGHWTGDGCICAVMGLEPPCICDVNPDECPACPEVVPGAEEQRGD